MLKGIVLGICIATFIVSLLFISSGLTENLQENIITGAAIGSGELVSYSFIALFVSFIVGLFVASRIGTRPEQESNGHEDGLAERVTLSKIQALERAKGNLRRVAGGDVLAELKKSIKQGRSREGVFYRTVDPKELRAQRDARGLPKNAVYEFANIDKEVNEAAYGYEGMVQVAIKGKAVPYEAAAAEGEMLIYNIKSIKPIKVFKPPKVYTLEES